MIEDKYLFQFDIENIEEGINDIFFSVFIFNKSGSILSSTPKKIPVTKRIYDDLKNMSDANETVNLVIDGVHITRPLWKHHLSVLVSEKVKRKLKSEENKVSIVDKVNLQGDQFNVNL